MIVAHAAAAQPVPWSNGGGRTRELLRVPATAGPDGAWTLRISVADIDADGPFSELAGLTRWFAVVAGAGVRLHWPDRAFEARPGDAPLCFDGAPAPRCTLLDGPTRDLNVMVRRGRGDVRVSAASWQDAASPGAAAGFGFFALHALLLHGASANALELPALSLAWCEPPFPASAPWRLEPAPATAPPLPGYWIRLLPAAP